MRRDRKCAKPTCSRKEQTGGYCKHHYRVVMAGRPTGMVDAAPVVEHVSALAAAWISGNRLAQLVGMPQTSILRISQGRHGKVMAATAAKLLAVPVPDLPPYDLASNGACMPATGTARRLQALQVAGYSTAEIASRSGVKKRAVISIAGGQRHVTAEVARRVVDTFNDLQLIPGPNEVTRQRSLRKGWVHPLAWDEDTIDDPNAEPFVDTSQADWYDEYLDLQRMGLVDKRIAERLGIGLDALKARLRRRREVA